MDEVARQDVGRERRSWWEESVHGWDAFGAEARLEIMHACDEVTREVTLGRTGWAVMFRSVPGCVNGLSEANSWLGVPFGVVRHHTGQKTAPLPLVNSWCEQPKSYFPK